MLGGPIHGNNLTGEEARFQAKPVPEGTKFRDAPLQAVARGILRVLPFTIVYV
jgi:hypothetical protein